MTPGMPREARTYALGDGEGRGGTAPAPHLLHFEGHASERGNFAARRTSQPTGRMSTQLQGMERIRRLAAQAERRIRLGRALRVGATALCAALVLAIVDVVLRK